MRHFDAALEGTPDYVWQAGTFNGNAIACAAGLATLAELRRPGAYERLFKTGGRLRDGLAAAVRKHGLAAQVSGEPPVFDLFFTDRPSSIIARRSPPTGQAHALQSGAAPARSGEGRQQGLRLAGPHRPDVDDTLEIFDQALAAIAADA